MERRTFVKGPAASLVGLPLLPQLTAAANEQLQTLGADLGALSDAPTRWRRVRNEFNYTPDLIHLNCGTIGATPRPIVEALCNLLHELESSPYHHTFEGTGLYGQIEGVRDKAASFLGVSKDEVALTTNTTEGMNGVATGLKLQPGDEILTTNHEHGGGMVGWQYLAKHCGVKIVQFKIPPPAQSKEQILQLVADHLSKRTRVYFFSHVETITGMVMPLAEISALVRPKGILLVCDGAQAPGMIEVDLKALGLDTYASSSHKWMLAPKGSGLLYIRKEAQARVQPVTLHSGYSAYSGSVGTRGWPQLIAHGLNHGFSQYHRSLPGPGPLPRTQQLPAPAPRHPAPFALPHPHPARTLFPGDRHLCLGQGKKWRYRHPAPRRAQYLGQTGSRHLHHRRWATPRGLQRPAFLHPHLQ